MRENAALQPQPLTLWDSTFSQVVCPSAFEHQRYPQDPSVNLSLLAGLVFRHDGLQIPFPAPLFTYDCNPLPAAEERIAMELHYGMFSGHANTTAHNSPRIGPIQQRQISLVMPQLGQLSSPVTGTEWRAKACSLCIQVFSTNRTALLFR